MKVLITGGSGFVGTHLTKFLLNHGHEVCVYDLQPTSLPEVEFIQGDILDEQMLYSALHKCDAVVHLAAQVSVHQSILSPNETHKINVLGTKNVFKCTEKAKIQRIIVASSAAVYGDAKEIPLKEENTGNLLSPYAHSKAKNEQQVLEAIEKGREAVALRFFNIYGPNQKTSGSYSAVIPSMLKCITEGQQPTIYGDGMQTRDFIHVQDASACIVNLLSVPWKDIRNHVYNVASQQQTSVLDLLSSINRAAIEDGIIQKSTEPMFEPAREGDIRHSVADISRIERDVGWKPQIDFNEGIRSLVKSWGGKK